MKIRWVLPQGANWGRAGFLPTTARRLARWCDNHGLITMALDPMKSAAALILPGYILPCSRCNLAICSPELDIDRQRARIAYALLRGAGRAARAEDPAIGTPYTQLAAGGYEYGDCAVPPQRIRPRKRW